MIRRNNLSFILLALLINLSIASNSWASTPLDPEFSRQWWLENNGVNGVAGADISMLPALEVYQPKREVVIAIIDSGFDLNHEDFDTSILWVNQAEMAGLPLVDDDQNGYVDDINGFNMVMKNHDFTDHKGHGTHVIGLIAAASNNDKGIFASVPGIKIMLIKLWDLGGDILTTPTAEAIRYACDNGADILSNSYGTPSANQATREAIEYCQEQGALFVGAAGNFGQNLDQQPDYPSSFAVDNQIVVGSSNRFDGRSLFSNFGKTIDLFAPGEEIYSLKPKNLYHETSGTSQACPLVAQAAAMTLAHNPDLTLPQLKERLIYSGDQRLALNHWSKNGRRLNVYKSLLGIEGDRLPDYNFESWQRRNDQTESPHPYPRRQVITRTITQPGAIALRLHFDKMEISKYDWLTLHSADGQLIDQFNGAHEAFWTQVIPGESVTLTLTSHSGPLNYGFFVDQIQWQAE